MRFKTFVGLDTERSLTENSLTRLHLPFFKREIDRATGAERIVIDWRALRSRKEIESLNVLMIQRLRDLSHVRTGWEVAIDKGRSARVVPAIRTDSPLRLAPYHVQFTLRYFLGVAATTFGLVASLTNVLTREAAIAFGVAGLFALHLLRRSQ